jgi:hypothetical protein
MLTKGKMMILRTMKRNFDQLRRGVVPMVSAPARRVMAHGNVDRETQIKNIQVAYKVSVREAEAQIDAAESRSQKMRKAAAIFARP